VRSLVDDEMPERAAARTGSVHHVCTGVVAHFHVTTVEQVHEPCVLVMVGEKPLRNAAFADGHDPRGVVDAHVVLPEGAEVVRRNIQQEQVVPVFHGNHGHAAAAIHPFVHDGRRCIRVRTGIDGPESAVEAIEVDLAAAVPFGKEERLVQARLRRAQRRHDGRPDLLIGRAHRTRSHLHTLHAGGLERRVAHAAVGRVRHPRIHCP
jgi:hypothetical protein